MRTLGGVVLGILLFFPGIVFLQWISVSVLGWYDAMTLTDGCLVMIIILMCVFLVHLPRGQKAARKQRRPDSYAAYGETELHYLNGSGSGRPRRASRRNKTTPTSTRR
jgi:hypothetical protein